MGSYQDKEAFFFSLDEMVHESRDLLRRFLDRCRSPQSSRRNTLTPVDMVTHFVNPLGLAET
jgi:hypothetical protein